MKQKICVFLSQTWIWLGIAIIALLISICIEFGITLIQCESEETADAANNVIKALSYSYIAAAIFHILVNYCPQKMRQGSILRFINHRIFELKEKIRQSKTLVESQFTITDSNLTKAEYIDKFAGTDFYSHFLGQDKFPTLKEKLSEYRQEICRIVSELFALSEFLTKDQFDFICKIATSNFITNELITKDDACDESFKNQQGMGEAIYDLYETSKKITTHAKS